MSFDPELVAFGQWLVNQGVAVAALAATVLYIGRKLDEGNKLLDNLLLEQRGNSVILHFILSRVDPTLPPQT